MSMIDLENPTIESCEAAIIELKELVASDAWKLYVTLIEAQQRTRLDSIILSPLGSFDGALEQEYRKGEIQGLKSAVQYPQVLLDMITETLAILRQEREADESKGAKE